MTPLPRGDSSCLRCRLRKPSISTCTRSRRSAISALRWTPPAASRYRDQRDWDKYDTAHVVFQPKHISCEELDRGYAWCYDRLFSYASIWRRRPEDPRAVLAYLAMSYLYKRSNRIWRLLIKLRLTGSVWRPLIEHSRRRHLQLRSRLERSSADDDVIATSSRASQYISPGV